MFLIFTYGRNTQTAGNQTIQYIYSTHFLFNDCDCFDFCIPDINDANDNAAEFIKEIFGTD